jgi:hypothetical protein
VPRKVFVAGEILTAADVNTNLMDQAVMVFDDSAARGSAIPSPSEGMVTYLKDTNQVQAYDGSAFAPIGTILQVVSTTKTDTFSTTSTSFTDVTGLSVSITPSSATSKVLIFAAASISADLNAMAAHARIVRDSTAIAIGDTAGSRTRVTWEVANGSGVNNAAYSMVFLDSPATTSALTYKVDIRSNTGTATVVNGRSGSDTDGAGSGRSVSSITVLEVAG